MSDEFLWTEKYRPHKIDDTILPVKIKETLHEFVKQKQVPNIILAGSPGTGKTTAARAMLDEIGAEYIVINASLNRNIDTLRNEIANYASSVSFTGGRKYVILDEADYLNCFGGKQRIMIFENNDPKEVNLEDIVNKNVKIVGLDLETKNTKLSDAFVFCSGEEEVFEVEFEDGSKMFCTKEHEFFNKNLDGVNICDSDELVTINIDIDQFIQESANESVYISNNKQNK